MLRTLVTVAEIGAWLVTGNLLAKYSAQSTGSHKGRSPGSIDQYQLELVVDTGGSCNSDYTR